jgi:hypothetical protein
VGIPLSGTSTALGIYRAIVLNNVDPLQRQRVQVLVPSISGQASGWAACCGPAGGSAQVPQVGATVWVMFEGGDPAYPVWLGVMP